MCERIWGGWGDTVVVLNDLYVISLKICITNNFISDFSDVKNYNY